MIVDEAHMIKNKDSIRGKIVAQIAENIPKVWLLTGTPISNRPMDYYNLLKICKVPVTDNFQHFAYRYCAAKSFNKKLASGKIKRIWLTDGASNLEELHQKTKNYILRRKKEDHLDLPPKIISPFYLELENRKGYESAFEEYVTWLKLEGRRLGPARQMVEMVVLRKFISQEKIPHTIDMVQNFLEQSETKKVIIFTVFTESLKKLKDELGDIAVCHNGEMSDKEKQKSIDKFQNDPKVRVFIGNIVSAGSAITLTASDTTLFHDIDFVPANHQQAEDRSYRIGQDKTVNIYYPIFENSIEEKIYEILQKKKEIISKVMGEKVDHIDIAEDFISTLFKI
jgi:SWI/SNF-related matrix-associated actin-dependent regulator 1 of chromatin subfamily A